MTEDLENKLFNEFPNLYKIDDTLQRNLMKFGFMCGDGWFKIIYNLSKKLSNLNLPDDFEVFEVKEKFGGLRYYVNDGNEEVYKLISEAEEKSYTTCEVCGKIGKIRNSGWVKTLCDECNNTL